MTLPPDYKALAKRLSDTLMTVAPLGGSECFIRVGNEYYADPEFFTARILELREAVHKARVQAAVHAKNGVQ
jgi:hypothetical protein